MLARDKARGVVALKGERAGRERRGRGMEKKGAGGEGRKSAPTHLDMRQEALMLKKVAPDSDAIVFPIIVFPVPGRSGGHVDGGGEGTAQKEEDGESRGRGGGK
eukprot:1138694-Rhodomonas_salina.2